MFLGLLYAMVLAWLGYGVALLWRERAMQTRGVHIIARVKGNETTDGSTFRPILGYIYEGRYYEQTYPYADKTKYAVDSPMELTILQKRPDKPLRVGESLRRTYGFSFVVSALALALAVYLTIWR